MHNDRLVQADEAQLMQFSYTRE